MNPRRSQSNLRTTLIAGLLLSCCLTLSAQTTHQAEAVRGTPEIDGKRDEIWDTAPRIIVRTPVPQATTIDPASAAWAQARMLWDEEHLYVLFDVDDDRISTIHGEPWQQDGVEAFVDENNGKTKTYETDDGQYRVSAAGNRSGLPDVSGVRAKVREHDDGYLVEMAIAFRELKATPDTIIGFDAQVNDNDGRGPRHAIMKWSDPTDRTWQDTSGFGVVTLKQKATLADQPLHTPASTGAVAEATEDQGNDAPVEWTDEQLQRNVPDWVADAVFYQIFPERFRNGDPSNDPTLESLEFPGVVPKTWTISPWTGDWYARADWEKKLGDNFYEDGVFHRRYGGDLQGVLEKVDYLKELGINTIYFNPVFYARSLHKYDGNSFHHVDPHFGPDPVGDKKLIAKETSDPGTWVWTAADTLFLKLIEEAHRRDIRIIIDGVFNHTGRDFFAFADLRENQEQSPYRDWYIVESFDKSESERNEFKYEGWWGVETLPVFADNSDGTNLHPGPKAYVFASTRRWMDPNGDGDPEDGIDGWRLDVANEVPIGFWEEWNRLVRELNPQAYTVSEIWQDATSFLNRGGFSATMNYHGFAFLVKGWLIDGTLPPSKFAEDFQARQKEYPQRMRCALQNLIDSHDTDRLASMIVNTGRGYVRPERFDYDVGERVSPRHDAKYNVQKPNARQRKIQRLVTLFQMTCIGAPMVYYGTEAGMWGADDPCDRMPMVWPELTYDDATHDPLSRDKGRDAVAFDHSLFRFHQDVIRLRRQSPVLNRGEFKVVSTNDEAQTLSFLRKDGNAWVLVALNRSDKPQVVKLSNEDLAIDDLPKCRTLFSLQADSDDKSLEQTSKGIQIRLQPLSGIVCAPE